MVAMSALIAICAGIVGAAIMTPLEGGRPLQRGGRRMKPPQCLVTRQVPFSRANDALILHAIPVVPRVKTISVFVL
jgi:hypothetical protein